MPHILHIKKYIAELIGTFWFVIGGCGSAVIAAGIPNVGLGYLGVAFAFGLTVLTMAYAIGHISGCQINPAVTIGLWTGGRFPGKEILPYIVSQVIGGAFLYLIASGKPGFNVQDGFASIGYGEHSPGGYSLGAAVFTGGWAIKQLWVFWIAPIAGAVIRAVIYRYLSNEKDLNQLPTE